MTLIMGRRIASGSWATTIPTRMTRHTAVVRNVPMAETDIIHQEQSYFQCTTYRQPQCSSIFLKNQIKEMEKKLNKPFYIGFKVCDMFPEIQAKYRNANTTGSSYQEKMKCLIDLQLYAFHN